MRKRKTKGKKFAPTYAFESASWNVTFPHQLILEENFCAKDDKEFVDLLQEMSKGNCSKQSAHLIKSLRRLPLKLAWAMTVHKAQGQTLDTVEVYCGREFAPGHLYVAMSKVRSSNQLHVIGFKEDRLIPAPKEVLKFLGQVPNKLEEEGCKCCRVKIS